MTKSTPSIQPVAALRGTLAGAWHTRPRKGHGGSGLPGHFAEGKSQRSQVSNSPIRVPFARIVGPIVAGLFALAPAASLAQAAGERSAVVAPACDRACLLGALGRHMDALRAKDVAALHLAPDATITENNVVLQPGEGLWRTVTAVDAEGLEAADPLTGNAAWFGSVRENGEPAIYAVRIHVDDAGAIDEIESVVHRKTALPAPFGDVTKMVHDPEFDAILPPEERRPRERMLSIADGYFSTVELNDGQIFTDFAEDCGRLENGISTTAPTPGSAGGNAAAIASGCREQFLLGIYRINKRIRRDFFILDEERGVAVGRGLFDHANEFDRYLLTNGREMKTALKWPNSITLLEAFRIRDGEIQRIEAVFTYVPYFMHNPFWGPDSTPPQVEADPAACDAACLAANARKAVGGMVGNEWRSVPWAEAVGYAENSVGIRVGEGIWATVTAVDPEPLVVTDTATGKAVWIGRIEEHGQPAWAAFTVSSAGDGVAGIDALIRRKEYGPPYAEPAAGSAPDFAILPPGRRTSREAMQAAFRRTLGAINKYAPAPDVFTAGCRLSLNGQDIAGCAEPFGAGMAAVGGLRNVELLAADETRGLLVYRLFQDLPALGSGYPLTEQIVEVFSFDNGRIAGIDAWTSELPYGMKPHGAD